VQLGENGEEMLAIMYEERAAKLKKAEAALLQRLRSEHDIRQFEIDHYFDSREQCSLVRSALQPQAVKVIAKETTTIINALKRSEQCLVPLEYLIGFCVETPAVAELEKNDTTSAQDTVQHTKGSLESSKSPESPESTTESSEILGEDDLLKKYCPEEISDFILKNAEGFTALMLAAEAGHAATVQLLLQEGAFVMTETHQRISAPHIAAANGHAEVLAAMLAEPSMNIAVQDTSQNNIVHKAASKGHVSCLEKVFQSAWASAEEVRSQLVDSANHVGYTAILLAARHGHHECLAALVAAKCNINLQTPDGFTALHIAAVNGNPKCIEALYRCVGALELLSERQTCEQWQQELKAIQRRKAQLELDEIAAIKVFSHQRTAESRKTIDEIDESVEAATIEAKELTDRIAEFEQRASDLEQCSIDNVIKLKTFDVDSVCNGNTALHMAAMANVPDCAATLLKLKAHVNRQNRDSLTAAMLASLSGHHEVIDVLVEAGADLTLCVRRPNHDSRPSSRYQDSRSSSRLSGPPSRLSGPLEESIVDECFAGYTAPEWVNQRAFQIRPPSSPNLSEKAKSSPRKVKLQMEQNKASQAPQE